LSYILGASDMDALSSLRALGCSTTMLVILTSAPSFAHHPGGPGNTGGAGPINTISATTLPQGKGVVGIVVDYLALGELSDRTLIRAAEEAGAAGEEHAGVHSLNSIVSPSLNLAYGVTTDLTVSLRLPYVMRTDVREGEIEDGEPEAHVHGDAQGIGDLTALAQWRFFNNRGSGTDAAVLLGVTAPTGKTDDTDNDGERFDAEFQPGTGAWYGLFGLALTQRVGAWSFDASVLYTASTEGTQSTDLGDRFHYNAAASYRLIGGQAGGPMYAGAHDHSAHSHSEPTNGPAFDLILEFNGEWQDEQEEAGEVDGNSGGHVLYIAPGARVSMGTVSAYASVGIPIVNDLNGLQSEPDVRVVSGVTVGF
jgi:hypothetical protein